MKNIFSQTKIPLFRHPVNIELTQEELQKWSNWNMEEIWKIRRRK